MEKKPEQISLLAESHASHSALQENGKGRPMTVISGLNIAESYRNQTPLGSFLKMLLAWPGWNSSIAMLEWKARPLYRTQITTFTLQRSYDKRTCCSTKSVENLKKTGTTFSRLLYQLVPSTRHIGATESGYYATPNTLDHLPPRSAASLERESTLIRPGRSKPANLRDQIGNAGLWPTPSHRDWKDTPGMAIKGTNPDGSERTRSDQLARVVYQSLMPTPTGQDNIQIRGKGKATGKRGTTLGGMARLLPTPKSTPSGPDNNRVNRPGSGGNDLSTEIGGVLNPEWVEWLMGYPIGWTELKD